MAALARSLVHRSGIHFSKKDEIVMMSKLAMELPNVEFRGALPVHLSEFQQKTVDVAPFSFDVSEADDDTMAGLMGYDGHAQSNTDARVGQTQDSSDRLFAAKGWVEEAGVEVPLLSGAGSVSTHATLQQPGA